MAHTTITYSKFLKSSLPCWGLGLGLGQLGLQFGVNGLGFTVWVLVFFGRGSLGFKVWGLGLAIRYFIFYLRDTTFKLRYP